jgi:CubicO group peptidase (beta-lactamase class C family)
MKTLSALIAALFLLPGLVRGQAAPPAAEAVSAKVDEIFAPFKSQEAPGCAVAVGEGDRTAVSRAYGMADLEHDVPNTPETIFEAGSVSKQFTAAAVLLLVQQGKLSLQDDVRKHLPELPEYPPAGTKITIEHLLHHTSGLRDWGAVAEIAGWPRGTRIHTHDHVLDIASRQKALNYEPGRYYSYTNTGYNLLVIIAERVSGQTFQEFSRKNIFEPLGMTHTQWRDDFSRIVKGRAIAYGGEAGSFHSEMPFENVFGNGGLLTTVGDLLLWNENFVHGKIGGPAFLQEIQRRGRLSDGQEIEYASGLFMTSWQGIPEVSHSGATAGYRAFLARYPEQKLSVAVLCNAGAANPVDLAHRTAGLFLASQLKPPPPPTPIQLAPEVLAARAGLYRSLRTGMPVRLVVVEGRLQMEDGPPLVPLSESRFQLGEDTIVEIDMGSDRRPTGLRLVRSSGDVVPLERVAEAAPTPAQLAEYVGEYTSDEAEVSYRVVLEDGKLVVRGRPVAAYPLKPLYADGFDAVGLLVRFRRDADGRVNGLSLGMPRMWDLRFARVR